MKFSQLITILKTLPAEQIFEKAVKRLKAKAADHRQKYLDLRNGTHSFINQPLIQNSYIDTTLINCSKINPEIAHYLSIQYCEHRFDLLGSGWVKNSYESIALGVEGYRYQMNVNKREKSPNPDYEPIDWQKDFKSGYRWDEKKWHKNQKYGHKLGVDIKIPWELARMQHLPQLAIFAIADEALKLQNIQEFKCQVLDFIANNPPRMGVNWVCTMDVAIRAANLLVAYDLFTQIDHHNLLDEAFKQVFTNSMHEHGFHIANHLEYSDLGTSNHYLSDIAGLLFLGAYLPSSNQVDGWLAFAIQEFFSESDKQFYDDGGNFESSSSYHRLSSELVIYGLSLILGLKSDKIQSLLNLNIQSWQGEPKLNALSSQPYSINQAQLKLEIPKSFQTKLFRIARFVSDLTKPNGNAVQFGDNDSGRFLKFSPNGEFITNREAVSKYKNLEGYNADENPYWDENILNHQTLLSCFGGIFEHSLFQNSFVLEKSIIANLAKRKFKLETPAYSEVNPIPFDMKDKKHTHEVQIDFDEPIEGLESHFYPESSIYIFKAKEFHLAICATPIGQNGWGGHTHNDKLSYELAFGQKNYALDPGTYLYTPLPMRRNQFRSTYAHNVPIVNHSEQNDWFEGFAGLFHLMNQTKCRVTSLDSNFIELVLEYKNIWVVRSFEIETQSLIVRDCSNFPFDYNEFAFHSNGYGKLSDRSFAIQTKSQIQKK